MLILRVGRAATPGDEDARLSRENGINSEHARSGREALGLMRLHDYDLILVDLDLPDMPGHEVIRLARSIALLTPSILLAGTASSRIRVEALDLGADDFVMMPCHPDELLARVRAVVRRGQGHAGSVSRFGPVELNLGRREARVGGRKLSLTRREFDALALMLLKRGVVLNKDAFRNHLYAGMEGGEMKAIDVLICRVRQKLAMAGASNLIDTVRGGGYVLREPMSTVEVLADNAHVHASSLAA